MSELARDSSSGGPTVSVIIPVYNTGEYLAECLDSVLQQTLSDIEVLCVDDGSTDESAKILAEYARRDRRVKVRENPEESRGPGAARNQALEWASGEYVAFVDSDDKVHAEMLESLVVAARESSADVAMCCIRKFAEGDDSYRALCTYERTIPKEFDDVPFTWSQLGGDLFALRFASWNKVYRRSYLIDQDIRFGEDVFYEDLHFTYRALLEANRLRFVRRHLYYNRKQREGATTFDQGDRVFDAVAAMDRFGSYLDAHDEYRSLDGAFAAFRFRKLRNYLHKNDLRHIQPFYAALREQAQDPALEGSPRLSEVDHLQRKRIIKKNLFEYLVWDYWRLHHDRDSWKRRVKRERVRQQRQKARVRELRDEVARLTEENERLRARLDRPAVARRAFRRLRRRATPVAKRLLGPRGAQALRRVVSRDRSG